MKPSENTFEKGVGIGIGLVTTAAGLVIAYLVCVALVIVLGEVIYENSQLPPLPLWTRAVSMAVTCSIAIAIITGSIPQSYWKGMWLLVFGVISLFIMNGFMMHSDHQEIRVFELLMQNLNWLMFWGYSVVGGLSALHTFKRISTYVAEQRKDRLAEMERTAAKDLARAHFNDQQAYLNPFNRLESVDQYKAYQLEWDRLEAEMPPNVPHLAMPVHCVEAIARAEREFRLGLQGKNPYAIGSHCYEAYLTTWTQLRMNGS